MINNDELLPGDYVNIQSMISLIAVEALITVHPDKKAVRHVFDQVYSQMQAQPTLMGSPAMRDVCRQLIEKIFEDNPQPNF